MTQVNNLLTNLPDASTAEVFEALAGAKGVEIERIVSHGQSSPEIGWCEQDRNEWVMVLRGAARIDFDGTEDAGLGKSAELREGDSLNIPAGCRHRVGWTTPDLPTVWLAVHYPADQDPFGEAC